MSDPETYSLGDRPVLPGRSDAVAPNPASGGLRTVPVASRTESATGTPQRKPGRSLVTKTGQVAAVDLYGGCLLILLTLGIAAAGMGGVSGVRYVSGPGEPIDFPAAELLGPRWQSFIGQQVSGSEWLSLHGRLGVRIKDLLLSGFLMLAGMGLAAAQWRRSRRAAPTSGKHGRVFPAAAGLCLLGLFVQSIGHAQTRFVLTDPLTVIGGGLLVGLLVMRGPVWFQGVLIVGLLSAHTLWFALAEVPEYGAALQSPELEMISREDGPAGRFRQWQPGHNIADWTDRQWMSRVPGQPDARFRATGRVTANFVPAVAILLLGGLVFRGLLARKPGPMAKSLLVWLAGLILILAGVGCDQTIVPAIERLLTASWVLLAAGYLLLLLGSCLLLIHVLPLRGVLAPIELAGRYVWPLFLLALFGVVPLTAELLKHGEFIARSLSGQVFRPETTVALMLLLPCLLILAAAELLDRRSQGGHAGGDETKSNTAA